MTEGLVSSETDKMETAYAQVWRRIRLSYKADTQMTGLATPDVIHLPRARTCPRGAPTHVLTCVVKRLARAIL